MKIYLIGMPLSGKTTIKNSLSKKLDFKVLDLDDLFTIKYGNISNYINLNGEQKFRKLESNILKEVSSLDENLIISTGGGVVTEEKNLKYMKSNNSLVIFLKISYDTFLDRIKKHGKDNRPLLKEYKNLYKSRQELYNNFSDLVIECDNKKVSKITNEIKKIIEKRKVKKVLVLNGPNLNMLGKRNKEQYGNLTLKELNKLIKKSFKKINFKFIQYNSEEKIINLLHKVNNKFDGIIFNPAAYTHTSVAIRDALEMVNIPVVIVHLSDINNREDFRKVDLLKDYAVCVISGKKEKSYIEGVKFLN